MKLASLVAATLVAAGLFGAPAWAGGPAHKLAIQVDQDDPAVMNMALNNAANARSYYQSKGEDVTIEIVAYGPGLKMYTADSPVKNRISTMSLESSGMKFSACGNTYRAMSQKAGHDIELVDEAEVVPSGVVRLMELQEDGYSYVRP